MLIRRGQNRFVEKVTNAAAGGAVGAIIFDSEEGFLFRMGCSEEEEEEAALRNGSPALPPALFIPKNAGELLGSLMKKGLVSIKALEPCAPPASFICVGAAAVGNRVEERSSARWSEIWVVADPASTTLGQVLWVPLKGGPAVVLANSLADFVQDLVKLDRAAAAALAKRAPRAMQLLRHEHSPRARRHWSSRTDDAEEHGPGDRDGLSQRSRLATRGSFTISDVLTAAIALSLDPEPHPDVRGRWDDKLCEYHATLRCGRVTCLQLDHVRSGSGADPTRLGRHHLVRAEVDMSMSLVSQASGLPLGVRTKAFRSVGSADVLRRNCLLVEQESGRGPGMPDGGRHMGFRGLAIIDRLARFAPEKFQRCISGPAADAALASCFVTVRPGQMTVTWRASESGMRGSFHKQFRGTIELFVEQSPEEEMQRLVGAGDVVLTPAGHNEAFSCGTAEGGEGWRDAGPSSSSASSPEAADGGMHERRTGLDEPDSAWTLRRCAARPSGLDCRGGGGGAATVEEDVVVFRALGVGAASGKAPVLRLHHDQLQRMPLLPVQWHALHSTMVGLAVGRPATAPPRAGAEGAADGGAAGDDAADAAAADGAAPGGEPAPPPTVAAAGPSGAAASAGATGDGPTQASSATEGLPPQASDDRAPGPNHHLTVGPGNESVTIVASFPGARCAGDLHLDVSRLSARIAVAAQAGCAAEEEGRRGAEQRGGLEIALPFEVDPASARARFNKAKEQLTVRIRSKDNDASDAATPP